MTIAVWIEGTVMKISLQLSSRCLHRFAQMPCPFWLLSAYGGHSHMKCDCIVNRFRVALSEYWDYTQVFCIAHIKLLHPSDISFIPPFTREFLFENVTLLLWIFEGPKLINCFIKICSCNYNKVLAISWCDSILYALL